MRNPRPSSRFRGTLLGLSLGLAAASCTSSNFAGGGGNGQNPSETRNSRGGRDDGEGDGEGDGDLKNGSRKGKGKAPGSHDLGNGDTNKNGIPDKDEVEFLANGLVRQRFTGSSTTSTRPVDIIFGVDTSGSMDSEKLKIEQNLRTFVDRFVQTAKGVDFHIWMIGEGFVFPNLDPTKITLVPHRIGSTDALSVFQGFLQGVIPSPTPLRDGATKQLVVITDDNAEEVRGPQFRQFVASMPNLAGKTRLHGFVWLPSSVESDWCTMEAVGTDYINLGADPELGGLIQDLCIADWSKLLDNLAQKIITEVARLEFGLLVPADPSGSFKVEVDGKVLDPTSYTYDEARNALVFAKDKAPPTGAGIKITYTPRKKP